MSLKACGWRALFNNNTLSHRATRNENTQVFQEHPVTPGDAEWKHTSLPRTPCYTRRRGMKTPKSSKNTLLHRATRNENTQVFQAHPVTPGDAEWKHASLPRTPCYTGRRGMKRQKSSKNTLLHRATRNEKTEVSLPRTPCYTGRRGMKRQKSSKNTLLHRATRNENTQVFQAHPVTPGDAEWKHASLPRTPCYTGRRGMKRHKSSKKTPATPGDAEWKDRSLPRTPCYTGRRGMKRQKSSKNTLLHRATRNENTQVFQEHYVTPGDAEWKHTSVTRTPCYTGRRGMKTYMSFKDTLSPTIHSHQLAGLLPLSSTLPARHS